MYNGKVDDRFLFSLELLYHLFDIRNLRLRLLDKDLATFFCEAVLHIDNYKGFHPLIPLLIIVAVASHFSILSSPYFALSMARN